MSNGRHGEKRNAIANKLKNESYARLGNAMLADLKHSAREQRELRRLEQRRRHPKIRVWRAP